MNQAIGSFVEKHRTDVAKMQAMSGKTFRSRRDDCVTAFIVSAMVMGIAVLLLVLRSVFGLSFEQFGRDMGPILGILGILFVLIAFVGAPLAFFTSPIVMLYYWKSPQRDLSCPFCKATHKLYASVTSYVCDSCHHVLLLDGRNSGDEPVVVECPLCGSQWASDVDRGASRCLNCGLRVDVHDGKANATSEADSCDRCRANVPRDLFFCPSCYQLHTDPQSLEAPPFVKTDTAYLQMFTKLPRTDSVGIDATIESSSRFGYLVRSLWLLRRIKEKADDKDLGGLDKAFTQAVEFLALSCESGTEHITAPLMFAFDTMLCVFYDSTIDRFGDYYYRFMSGDQVKKHAASLNSTARLYSSIIEGRLGTGQAEERDGWPDPLLDLTPSFNSTSRSYYGKVKNGAAIGRFVTRIASEEQPEFSDVAADVVRAMRPGHADRLAAALD